MSRMSTEKEGIKPVTTVALYIRVSSEEQVKHGYSLEAQQARLLDYCKQKGYKVHDVYVDKGKTARSKLNSRKEMLRLIEDAKEKKFNLIVFWKLDRWFRNVADYYKVQTILDDNHIDWECSDEEYNTTTSSGRLYLNIRLSVAQNESDQTGDRIRFNFNNMVKQGRPIQGTHCMPLGYIVDGNGKDKKVVKDPKTKHIVEDMFEHFNTYKSIRKTLIYINDKYDIKILYDSMTHYFKNTLYYGTYWDNENYCEPYISKQQFQKNLNVIKKRARNCTSKHDYIFSGLIICPECNTRMAGYTHRTTKPKYNKVYLSHAYRCNKAHNSKLCKNKSPILEGALEKYLLANIEELLKGYVIKIESIESQDNNAIENRQDEIEKKITRLNDLYVKGRIDKAKYEKDYDLFLKELNEIKEAERKIVDIDSYKKILESNVTSIYHLLDNQSKRAFWTEFINKIERSKDLQYTIHFH